MDARVLILLCLEALFALWLLWRAQVLNSASRLVFSLVLIAAAFFAGRADACLFCTQFPPNVVYMRACALWVSGGAVRRAGYSE